MNSSFIQRYIDFHTTGTIKNRGQELYKSNAVSSAVYNKKDNSWLFLVKGSREYLVKIDGITKENIKTTSCTCPFDWGSTCKHTVAALLYIDNGGEEKPNITDKTQNQEEPIILNTRNQNNGFEIVEYKHITEDLIKKKYRQVYI